MEADLPIALRRRKRRCSSLGSPKQHDAASQNLTSSSSAEGAAHASSDAETQQPTAAITPSRTRRGKKRVRFSDPGPNTNQVDETIIMTPSSRRSTSAATGLTPAINRTKISTPSAHRRLSAPATVLNGTPHPSLALSTFDSEAFNSTNGTREIQFTPLRQVLDERCKRRIRRHGLSEELNRIDAEKKEREALKKEIESKDEMLKKMREELETSKEKITKATSANNSPTLSEIEGEESVVLVPASTQQTSIDEVEEELRQLRRSMEDRPELDASGADKEIIEDSLDEAANAQMQGDLSTAVAKAQTPAQKIMYDDDDTIRIFEDDDVDVDMDDDDDEIRTEPFDPESSFYRAAFSSGSNHARFTAAAAAPAAARDAATTADLPDLRQDAELLTMALQVEEAKQEKREIFKEWREHFKRGVKSTDIFGFTDSPSSKKGAMVNAGVGTSIMSSTASLPDPPPGFLQQLSRKLKTTTTRAEDAELALCALETELRTLGFAGRDGSDIVAEIKRQFRSARLDLERVAPGETTFGFDSNRNLLPEILAKMKGLGRQIRDREAELRSLNEQHRALKGNFDHACTSIDQASKKIRDLEETIDENAEELLDRRMRVQELEKEDKNKDETVRCLSQALDRYRADVDKLEKLITEMEAEEPFKIHAAQEEVERAMTDELTDVKTKLATAEAARQSAEQAANERHSRLQDLEAAYEAANNLSLEVQIELRKLADEKEVSEFALKKRIHENDEQHAAQLGSLNTRVSNLSTAYAEAEAEITRLRGAKERLEARLQAEIEQGHYAVESIQHELIRTMAKVNESRKSYLRGTKIRTANSEIEEEDHHRARDSSPSSSAPNTPVSLVRFADVEMGRGKGRYRRERGGKSSRGYDSGVGMSSEAEDEAEDDGESIDHDEAMIVMAE